MSPNTTVQTPAVETPGQYAGFESSDKVKSRISGCTHFTNVSSSPTNLTLGYPFITIFYDDDNNVLAKHPAILSSNGTIYTRYHCIESYEEDDFVYPGADDPPDMQYDHTCMYDNVDDQNDNIFGADDNFHIHHGFINPDDEY